MTTKTRILRNVPRHVWVGMAALCGMAGQVAGQTATRPDRVREVPAGVAVGDAVIVRGQTLVPGFASGRQNVPQDVRIMQTIVRTALSQVEAPKLPEELAGDSTEKVTTLTGGRFVMARGRSGFLGSGDVSGFYMQGYGYLFTVHWPVSALSALRMRQFVSGGGGDIRVLTDAKKLSPEATAWADQYRQRLSDALRDVVAGYGSTLRRAAPGESITFIADFGDGDDETVTMTAKAGALHGSDVQGNRAAVHVSRGQSATSGQMRTQLEIMSEIIDTSLRGESTGPEAYELASVYFGGSAEPQYVPGYGVLFRKNARMNTMRFFAETTRIDTRRAAIDSAQAASQKNYRAHLDTLRHKTAEILASYGPTLTEMQDDDWVGLYFDVGSAAALLNGGTNDYLVQARMRDIRQAAAQGDPAAWLEAKLVTNEAQE